MLKQRGVSDGESELGAAKTRAFYSRIEKTALHEAELQGPIAAAYGCDFPRCRGKGPWNGVLLRCSTKSEHVWI